MKRNLLISILIFVSQFSSAFNNEHAEYEKLSRAISQYLLNGTVKEFTKEYVPTKEDVLELAYQKEANEVPITERLGFYKTITPTIDYLGENHFSSYNFLQHKLKDAGISKLESIVVNSVEDKAFMNSTV